MFETKKDGPKRWPRGQKFTLSPLGVEAEVSYRSCVAVARTTGRSALAAALAAWAEPLRLAAGDGIILGELREARMGVSDLCKRLEDAGIAPDEVRGALERLVAAGVVAPLPLASQVA
jgi:hypothetical protein